MPQRQVFTPISSTTLQLPKQLWSGISHHLGGAPQTKVSAEIKQGLPTPASVANNLVQTALIRKMRRLSLIKKLLRGNKFSKLARLGELNALGEEYSALAFLGTLFGLGGFTEELKQQLLVQLATEIKLCATLCAHRASQPAPVDAITTSTSTRTLFTYTNPPVVFGRDPDFFISDTVPVRAPAGQVLQKTTLLEVLSNTKTKKSAAALVTSKGSNFVLTRGAEANTLSRAKHLQYYRRTLAVRDSDRGEQLSLLCGHTIQPSRPVGKNTGHSHSTKLGSAKGLAVQRSRGQLTARFVAAGKLTTEYRGTTSTVISPRL